MDNKRKKLIFLLISGICLVLCVAVLAVVLIVNNNKQDNINFVIEDTLPQGNNKQAKVILLGGQSNASGCSIETYLQKNVSAEKFAELKNGYDNIYINYYTSGNNISNGFVKTSTNQGEAGGHFGPEVGLAEKLHELYPNQIFFILKFAWGGTNLFEQWLSPSSQGKTGNLYHNFVRFVNQNMKYIKSKGYNAKIEGMCWMQGESDSFSTDHAIGYKNNLNNFIKDLRKDFKEYSAQDGIAFVDAYIANNPMFWVYCEMVNNSKKAVAESSELNVVIDTNAYGLVCDKEPEEKPDIPHYDSLSQRKLGNLFAEQLAQFL